MKTKVRTRNTPLSAEEKDSIDRAMNQVIILEKSRKAPSIVSFLERELEYAPGDLKRRKYHDFGSAQEMFDQAVSEGIIKYGPKIRGDSTLYLPYEEIPDDEDGET